MAIRTFLALDLDETIRNRIVEAARRIGDRGAKVKWVEPQNLHVTLKFLGDVQDGMVADVCAAAADAAARVQPFDFQVRGVIAVPPTGQLRMFWVGVEDPTGRTGALHEALDQALGPLGFQPEGRAFKPHVTLGRVRLARDPSALRIAAAPLAGEDFGQQRAEEVVVYSSRLTAQGPVYAPVSRARLGP